MMGRLSRIGLDVVLICALSALVLVVVGGWRLSHGPVSLGFLKPYAEERFAALDLPYEIAFSDIVLAWGGTSRPLGLAILDAELRSEEERAVARIPEVSLGLSLPSLLDGKFVLKTVELSEAGVEVIRYADGGLGVGLAGEGAGTFMLFELDAADRSGASLMGRLDHLAIHRAAISIDDRVLGLHMNADRASLDFERHEDAIVCVFDIDSVSAEERLALGGVAEYRLSDGTMHAALDFRDLVPGRYAQVLAERFPDLPDISGIAVPLRGRVEASADPDGALKQASFTVSGTEGSLRLAALDGHRYDFRSLVLDGRYAAGDGSVAVDRLDIDFGAPRLSLSGKLGRVDGIARLAARAKLDGMTMAALGRYWPEGVAAGTRRWLIANLDRGEVRDLAADFAAAFPAAGAKIEHAEVTFAVDAARVHYFRPLPPIIDAGASIAIDRDRVRIAVSGGKVEDLVPRGRTDRYRRAVDGRTASRTGSESFRTGLQRALRTRSSAAGLRFEGGSRPGRRRRRARNANNRPLSPDRGPGARRHRARRVRHHRRRQRQRRIFRAEPHRRRAAFRPRRLGNEDRREGASLRHPRRRRLAGRLFRDRGASAPLHGSCAADRARP